MRSTKNLEYQKTSFLNKSNSNFIENMYLRFIKNDSSLPGDWREYFQALNENIEELILGCSHYPLIFDFLRKKIDSSIKIIDPSEALIKKFNEAFIIPKTERYESISYDNVKFFVTSKKDEFSKKIKFWLEINKEISVVNLRSNV